MSDTTEENIRKDPKSFISFKDRKQNATITVSNYYWPLWELMHNDHGLLLLESEMQDIIAACGEVSKRLMEEIDQAEEWEECSSREAEQFRILRFNGEEWSPWRDMPKDMIGKQTGFSDIIKHRRRTPQ